MTNRVKSALTAQIVADLPDNTSQQITASDLRSILTDVNDTCFREFAIKRADSTGRLLRAGGGGYVALAGSASQQGPWSYATLAAAEASGDPWQDGDVITITSSPEVQFLYFTALAVSGYSGLIHRYPFDDGTPLVAPTTLESQAQNTDPNSWGWTDSDTITESPEDAGHDTQGGFSRHWESSLAGRFQLQAPHDTGIDQNTTLFAVIDGLSATLTTGSSGLNMYVSLSVYDATVTRYKLQLEVRSAASATNWVVNSGGGNFDTGKAFASRCRAFVYLKQNQGVLWFDDDAAPAVDDTLDVAGSSAKVVNFIGHTTNTTEGEISHGAIIYGQMSF
jgi:hypothetical protein